MDTGLNVFLPNDVSENGKSIGVLYLLHGQSDNCNAWLHHTRICDYAQQHKIAVIMPEVQRSFYTDMVYGLDYYTYIAEELPCICTDLFNLPISRSNTYIAGLSMGGYGALKIGLSRPDLFCGCAGFSSVTDIRSWLKYCNVEDIKQTLELKAIYGEDLNVLPKDDLFLLTQQVSKLPFEKQPKIFMSCGNEDDLYGDNQRMCDHVKKLGLDYQFMNWEGGHEWAFWEKSIQYALDYLVLK